MTSIATNYLSLSPISKTGIGGAITAAAYIGLGITNPITLVAATAIGQGLAWLPDMARRCFRRAPAAAALPAAPAPAAALPIPVRLAAEPGGLSIREELELQQALEMSRQDQGGGERKEQEVLDRVIARSLEPQPVWRGEDDDLDRALAFSLQDPGDIKEHGMDDLERVLKMSMDPQHQVKVCSLERAFKGAGENDPIEDDEIIPEQFLVDAGKNQYYHLGNLVLNLLSSHSGADKYGNLQCRDALGKVFTADDLEIFEARMGLNPGELVNIWVRATLPDAPQDVDPDTQAARRTTYRMCLLRDALRVRDHSPEVNKMRDSYLRFLSTKDVWTRLPAHTNMA